MLPGKIRTQRRQEKRDAQAARKFRHMHIKKGDTVTVLAGKSKGKTGRVMLVYPETERVMVERINLIKRHQRPTAQLQKGGIIEKENPLHISNVQLVCSHCKEPTRVRHDVLAEGKKVRFCKKCSEQIDRV